MEKPEVVTIYRVALFVMILTAIGGIAFSAGITWSLRANASELVDRADGKKQKVIYPKKVDLDYEGLQIEGELHNPGEFYFQHRPQEKFDSLVKRRKDFHHELLRDVVLSK